jgi:hypothetical protein
MVERMGLPEDAFLHRETGEMCRNFQRHYNSVERAWRSCHDQLGRILAARAKAQPQPSAPAQAAAKPAQPPAAASAPPPIGSVLHNPVTAVPQLPDCPPNQPYKEDGHPKHLKI